MGYKFKDQCYDTQAEALQSYADNCGLNFLGTGASSNTGAAWCKVNGTNIQIYFVQPGGANPSTFAYQYPVTFPTCTNSNSATFTNAEIIELSWLVVSVWVVAWGFKKMMEVLRK